MNFNFLILFLKTIKTSNDQNDDEKPSCSYNVTTDESKEENDAKDDSSSDTLNLTSLRHFVEDFFKNSWYFDKPQSKEEEPSTEQNTKKCCDFTMKDINERQKVLLEIEKEKEEINREIGLLTVKTLKMYERKEILEKRKREVLSWCTFCDDPSCKKSLESRQFSSEEGKDKDVYESDQTNSSEEQPNPGIGAHDSRKKRREEPKKE